MRTIKSVNELKNKRFLPIKEEDRGWMVGKILSFEDTFDKSRK